MSFVKRAIVEFLVLVSNFIFQDKKEKNGVPRRRIAKET
jgi:hypothetical protein